MTEPKRGPVWPFPPLPVPVGSLPPDVRPVRVPVQLPDEPGLF
jgi:hypothetical protein